MQADRLKKLSSMQNRNFSNEDPYKAFKRHIISTSKDKSGRNERHNQSITNSQHNLRSNSRESVDENVEIHEGGNMKGRNTRSTLEKGRVRVGKNQMELDDLIRDAQILGYEMQIPYAQRKKLSLQSSQSNYYQRNMIAID